MEVPPDGALGVETMVRRRLVGHHRARLEALGWRESGEPMRQKGREGMTLERTLDLKLHGILARIDRLVARTRRLEVGGLSAPERRQL